MYTPKRMYAPPPQSLNPFASYLFSSPNSPQFKLYPS